MLLAVVLAAVKEALHITSRDEVYLCTHNWTNICQMQLAYNFMSICRPQYFHEILYLPDPRLQTPTTDS